MSAEFTSKDGIIYEGVRGSLKISKNTVEWLGSDDSHSRFRINICDIRQQKVSPEDKPKVRMQLVGTAGKPTYVFLFESGRGRTFDLEERSKVKGTLAHLIPLNRLSQTAEGTLSLEEKKQAFENDQKLYLLYKELVVTEVMSAELFWSVVYQKSTSERKILKSGIPSDFWVNLVPETKGCNELVFSLSEDKISTVFKTYPKIAKKYEEFVPLKMTQEAFWKLFFQSKFFQNDKTEEIRQAKEFFKDCLTEDHEEEVKGAVNEILLCEPAYVSSRGYVDFDDMKITEKGILGRFNHQSTVLLKSLAETQESSIDLFEEICLEDLVKKDVGEEGNTKLVVPLLQTATKSELKESLILQDEIKGFREKLINFDCRKIESLEVARNLSFFQIKTRHNFDQSTKRIYEVVYSLTKILWSVFMGKCGMDNSKVNAILKSLDLYKSKIVDPKLQKNVVGKPVLLHLCKMIESVNKKHKLFLKMNPIKQKV